jgi:hypothetical protein
VVERDRMRLGRPVVVVDAAEANRNVVAHQLAATAGEDGRTTGNACPLLLAVVGREPSPPRLFGSVLLRILALPLPAV